MAAVETLIEVATRASHKDVDFYVKSLAYCRRYEQSEDFCNLVLKLFGSAEDKKIANIVADWAKARKYESSGSGAGNVGLKCRDQQQQYVPPSFYMNPTPFNPVFGAGPSMHASMQQSYPVHGFPPYSPYPANNFMRVPTRGRGRGRGASSLACFYCKKKGHLVAFCPEIKKD